MEITEEIKESIDNGKFGCGIFIDLKKAFDTVNHQILLTKLEHYGIRGVLLKWFESYLTNRRQYVYHNGIASDMEVITCGVPQGSVLGPLLFLIYINDIALEVDVDSNINLFADDTKIFSHSDTILQKSLDKIYHWLKERKLDLNPSKCQVLNTKKVHLVSPLISE